VVVALIKWHRVLLLVWDVLRGQYLLRAASYKLHVNVTLGTRGSMEAHAHSALPARINLVWGLRVQAVPLHQYLHLQAPQTPHVSATPGTRGQMETHARNAWAVLTKRDWALVHVSLVLLMQSPPLAVRHSQPVCAATVLLYC